MLELKAVSAFTLDRDLKVAALSTFLAWWQILLQQQKFHYFVFY